MIFRKCAFKAVFQKDKKSLNSCRTATKVEKKRSSLLLCVWEVFTPLCFVELTCSVEENYSGSLNCSLLSYDEDTGNNSNITYTLVTSQVNSFYKLNLMWFVSQWNIKCLIFFIRWFDGNVNINSFSIIGCLLKSVDVTCICNSYL